MKKEEYKLKDLEATPEWVIAAKYGSILQIVLAGNDWSQKYPLLEKIIDGLLQSALVSQLEEVEKIVEDMKKPDEPKRNIVRRSHIEVYNRALSDLLLTLQREKEIIINDK